jgi:ATP-dependent exoDNAse (exonuclease V) beta subunit
MLSAPLEDEEAPVHPLIGQESLARWRAWESAESDRVLYVAMTRAIESLFLSWNGEVKPNSWRGRLKNWNLDLGLHQSENYRYQVVESVPEVSHFSMKTSPATTPRPAYRPETSPAPIRNVTDIIAGHQAKEIPGFARRQELLARSLDGILIHELFESLRYADQVDLQLRFGERAEEMRQAIDFVKNQKEVPMMELLRHGFVEWGFSLIEQGASTTGAYRSLGARGRPRLDCRLQNRHDGSDQRSFRAIGFIFVGASPVQRE